MRETGLTSQFALDVQGTQKLKHSAASGRDPKALREASVQFEALFLQKMLKSMREAMPTSDLLKSQQTDFYNSLMDQQWAQHLAGEGIGLADQLISQISRQRDYGKTRAEGAQNLLADIPRAEPRILPPPKGTEGGLMTGTGLTRNTVAPDNSADKNPMSTPLAGVPNPEGTAAARPNGHAFVESVAPHARAVSKQTGIPEKLMLAQAVLETGWGRHQIAHDDGRNAHNLFGIKAGKHWQGETVTVVTHEYVDGGKQRVEETFRAYPSYRECFADYAALMAGNPRYAAVLKAPNERAAARALEEAGYATDPQYSEKLIALLDQDVTPLNAG